MSALQLSCAAIHDLSGLGKCSLTVILPVLSACGVETSALPTAVLSTHTGGFSDIVKTDLTREMLPTALQWKKEGCGFTALYSGYLASPEQAELTGKIFELFRRPGGLVLVDPVMGDGGKLYSAVSDWLAAGMRKLCEKADLITPNLTEAARLLELPYAPGPFTTAQAETLLKKLSGLGPRQVVLTGVQLKDQPGRIGAACYDRLTGETAVFLRSIIPGSYCGTGDLFAATLLGGLLNGMALPVAGELAVEMTHRSIITTHERAVDRRFGPKFETHLRWLSREVGCGYDE